MAKVRFWLVIGNQGDGSVKPYFYADEKMAIKAYKTEEKSGEGFTDNEPREIELEFDNQGKLLNPSGMIQSYE